MKNSVVKNLINGMKFDIEMIKKNSKEEETIRSLHKILNTLNSIDKIMDEIEDTNFVKRLLYTQMKDLRLKEPEKSRAIYITYQKLKENLIDAETALKELNEINIPL